MCIAVPRKVLSVEGLVAEVATAEGPQSVSLSLMSDPVAVGDYVTLQAGRYVVGRMDAEEARLRLALFAELFEADPADQESLP